MLDSYANLIALIFNVNILVEYKQIFKVIVQPMTGSKFLRLVIEGKPVEYVENRDGLH